MYICECRAEPIACPTSATARPIERYSIPYCAVRIQSSLSVRTGPPTRGQYEVAHVFTALLIVIAIGGFLYDLIRKRPQHNNDWERSWNARLAALESVLGPHDDEHIVHSLIPFHLDGGVDVVIFRKHLAGVVYVTADLIGDDRSRPNALGQYELMVCLREEADWAPQLLSWLAKYTIGAILSPGDTVDIGPALPQPTALSQLLFVPYARVTVDGKEAGILLCLGITPEEYDHLRERGYEDLIAELKQAGVYPFTELLRRSAVGG
jgi:hypothetical protein